jgi:hypothetical protein
MLIFSVSFHFYQILSEDIRPLDPSGILCLLPRDPSGRARLSEAKGEWFDPSNTQLFTLLTGMGVLNRGPGGYHGEDEVRKGRSLMDQVGPAMCTDVKRLYFFF